MAQTFQARRDSEGDYIDYTPSSDVDAGEVVLLGTNLVTVAPRDILSGVKGAVATRGVFDVVIKNESFTRGVAIYWDSTGDPYNGEAGTGAGTATASGNAFMGWVIFAATGGTDEFATVDLRSMEAVAAESIGLADLDDVGALTYTAGSLLVGDGDSMEQQAVSGAVTLGGTGVALINPDTDLGSSGIAGSLDIFPTTAASGKAAISVTDQAGDTTVSVVIGAMGQATVVTLDDPGADASFVTDEGAQTIGGLKAFTLMPTMPVATVAAVGSAQGDAAAVTTGFTKVTAADATKAIVLPAATGGQICYIANVVAQTLPIFPASGDSINEIAADSAYTMAASVSLILVSFDATEWYSFPLLGS
jgi:predicted RecA/RadA family phage recombinase